jgi:hypothetical protein
MTYRPMRGLERHPLRRKPVGIMAYAHAAIRALARICGGQSGPRLLKTTPNFKASRPKESSRPGDLYPAEVHARGDAAAETLQSG